MKAMILAAGLGERMRPLTDHTPKPLLRVGGVPLLEHHIRALAAAGFCELVINISHLAGQITDYFGDGSDWAVKIDWSREEEPLETAGGIINALPLLGEAPFALINGDVWTDYPFSELATLVPTDEKGAHLVLVANPEQHPQGDFSLSKEGMVGSLIEGETGFTYAGLGVYSTGFFAGIDAGKVPLLPLLNRAIKNKTLRGRFYGGQWVDVGTPARLETLDAQLRSSL
ncbi:MAG: nucleotidyltransferase family protein [Halioglobus sp.]